MPHVITKRYKWIAAHRIEGHDKCGRLHGHNYMVDVTVGNPTGRGSTNGLDDHGFIIDFGILNVMVESVLDTLDHRYMVAEENVNAGCIYLHAALDAERHEDLVYLPIRQTSAEMLAEHLKDSIGSHLYRQGYGHVVVMEVRVWETPKASATF